MATSLFPCFSSVWLSSLYCSVLQFHVPSSKNRTSSKMSLQIEPPSPKPRKSLSQEVITQVETRAMSPRALPGYTVSEIPTTWMEHVTTSKTSKVVEVADTFVGPKQMMDQYGRLSANFEDDSNLIQATSV